MSNDFLLQEFQQTELKEPPSLPLRVRRQKPIWREYAEVILIALAAAILLRLFVISAYRVDSSSMEDTLLEGDYIFVNQLAYRFGEPKIGDIVVFKSPLNPTKDYIKRIVALPGETVEVIDKVLYVDNQLAKIFPNVKNADPKILPMQLSLRDNFGPIQVPSDQYFVLGDNRDDSQDSRFWGFLPKENLKGRALFVYWSWAPDPKAPKGGFPYITVPFQYGFYFLTNFPSHTRWERLFTAL
ncbi:MAG: signal peptidase I [candidate division Zixibacteria bacterium]|jgi:signal peptidase I|nr:signal peptidase I [candidate division Zixibacteria bacterium]